MFQHVLALSGKVVPYARPTQLMRPHALPSSMKAMSQPQSLHPYVAQVEFEGCRDYLGLQHVLSLFHSGDPDVLGVGFWQKRCWLVPMTIAPSLQHALLLSR